MSAWAEPARNWSKQDRLYGLPTDQAILRLAAQMDAEHNKRRQKEGAVGLQVSNHREVGLFGERHIARIFGLTMDQEVRPWGSKRKNLILRDGTTIDVVTRTPLRSGGYPDIFRKVKARGKVDALILVIWYGRVYEPEVPGFIYEPDLLGLNLIREFREGHANYTAPVSRLSPLRFLVERHNPQSPYALEGSDWLLTDLYTGMDDSPREHPPDTPTPSQPSLFDVETIPQTNQDTWR